MSRKKKIGVTLFVFLLFGFGIFFVVRAANTSPSAEATNVVTIGSVQIALHMEKESVGKIEAEHDITNKISVENTGKYPAYLRIKVTKEWKAYHSDSALDPAELEKITLPNVDSIQIKLESDWKQVIENGECYYYYKNPVASGNSAIFSNSYRITNDVFSGSVLEKLSAQDISVGGDIKVVAEAIQADTLTPKKDANDDIIGWPSENQIPSGVTPSVDTSVTFEPGKVKEVKFETNDIKINSEKTNTFIDISGMMPGESKTHLIQITNASTETIPVYMYAKTKNAFSSLSEDEKELLRHLQLAIMNEKKQLVYSGPLFENDASKEMFSPEIPILLGKLPPGTSEKLFVAVKCPESWDKPNVGVKVLWVFNAKTALPSPTVTDNSGGTATISPTATFNTNTPAPSTIPQTTIPQVSETPTVSGKPSDKPNATASSASKTPKPTNIETSVPDKTPKPTDSATMPSDVSPTPVASNNTVTPIRPHKSESPKPSPTYHSNPKPTGDEEIETPEVITNRPSKTTKPEKTAEHGDSNVPQNSGDPNRKIDPNIYPVYPTKTGDRTPIFFWIICGGLSLIGGIWMASVLRREEK